jgi:tetratricopeptide (TPR) repeat protein
MKAAGKPGIVFTEPFKNFGYNRSIALNRAAEWGTYALLLDADMQLIIDPAFQKTDLTESGYSLLQSNGGLDYYNLRIAKTGIGIKCVGPTHEYYDVPPGNHTVQIQTLRIHDIGDGGAKSDKTERDIRLLTEALKTDPNNDRTHFYLANSYRDCGKYEDAIRHYQKRIEIGGWVEEVFQAALEIGNCYSRQKKMDEAIQWWMNAYQRHPKRAESLYEIIKYYRIEGKQHLAQLFLNTAKQIPYPKHDVLFIKKAIYDYQLAYEQSIIAFYTGVPYDHKALPTLLEHEEIKANVLDNYKFYAKKATTLPSAHVLSFGGTEEKEVGGRMDTFTSSSPCIYKLEGGYGINIRYVNYTIQGDGSYKFRHSDGKITTLQKHHTLDANYGIVTTNWIDHVTNEERRYQGVEDVKVLPGPDGCKFLGTVEDAKGNVTIGCGSYDPVSAHCLTPTALTSPLGQGCEKNWCYVPETEQVVYSWNPLRIGRIEGETLKIESTNKDVPAFFKDVRGSSHGYRFGSEVWFLCHLVQYTTPRHYYHLLVVLDAETLTFKRHSILFKFEGDCIEYALGLIVDSEKVTMSYSQMDRSSKVLVLLRSVVESELF